MALSSVSTVAVSYTIVTTSSLDLVADMESVLTGDSFLLALTSYSGLPLTGISSPAITDVSPTSNPTAKPADQSGTDSAVIS